MQIYGKKTSKLKSGLYLLIIWAISITIRIFLFTGYMNGDMGNYIQEAHNFAVGHYSVKEMVKNKAVEELVPNGVFNWQNLRLGLIVPVSFLMRMFGVNDFSYSVFSFGCFTVSFIIVYLFGKALVSESFGLLSVLLFSFIPQEINLTTILLPHVPASTFMGLSCFFLYTGIHMQKRWQTAYLLLSGFSLAFAYTIWEFSLLLIPVLVGYLSIKIGIKRFVFKREFWLSCLALGLGFLPLFFLETLYFYKISGVLFFRIKFISAMGSKWLKLHPIDLRNLTLDLYPRYMFGSYYFGVFFYFVCAGLLLIFSQNLLNRKNNTKTTSSMLLPVIWCCWLWAYLQFGSSSLSHYQPIFRMSQYLAVISIPGSILGAYFLFWLSRQSFLQKLGFMKIGSAGSYGIIMVIVLYISSSVIFAYANFAGNGSFHRDMTFEQKIKDKLSAIPSDIPIYTDLWTKNGLDYVFGYKRQIRAFNSLTGKANVDLRHIKCCVVINRIYLNSRHVMDTPIPNYVFNVPGNWKLISSVPGRSLTIDIYIKDAE